MSRIGRKTGLKNVQTGRLIRCTIVITVALLMVTSMMAPAVIAASPSHGSGTVDATESGGELTDIAGPPDSDDHQNADDLGSGIDIGSADTADEADTDDSEELTLVTGQTITVVTDGDDQRIVTDSDEPLHKVETSSGTYVYPEGIDFSVYDRSLFNIDYLLEEGYADADSDGYPLIVSVSDNTAGDQTDVTPASIDTLESISGMSGARTLGLINANAVQLDKEQSATALDRLDSEQGLESVHLDRSVEVALDESVPAISGETAREEYGVNGTNVTVAVLDSGVDADHPDLTSSVVDQNDFSGDGVGDRNGHGTHVAGTITGDGTESNGEYVGVAPDADVMDVKVLGDDGAGTQSTVIEGIEYAVDNDADLISMSLGGPVAEDDPIVTAVNDAIDGGTHVVVAGGNAGPDMGTIGSPGVVEDAITVGAADHHDDEVASFSSRGPTTDAGLVKPDLLAPGVEISAAAVDGGEDGVPPYTDLSGTSMATPHVSGVVALLLEDNPDLSAYRTKDTLVSTSDWLGGTNPDVYAQGAGMVNTTAAVSQDIVIENATTNFGVVAGDEDLEGEITVENNGDEPVKLLLEETVSEVTSGESAVETLEFTDEAYELELDPGETTSVAYTVNMTETDRGIYSGRLLYYNNETSEQYGAMFGYTVGEEVTVEKQSFGDDGSVEGDKVWVESTDHSIGQNTPSGAELTIENGNAHFTALDEKYVVFSPGFDEPTAQPVKTAQWLNTSETSHVVLDESDTVPVTLNDSAFDGDLRSIQQMPKTMMALDDNPAAATWTGLYYESNTKTVYLPADERLNATVAHALASTDQHDTGSNLNVDDVYYHVHHEISVEDAVEYNVAPDEFATVDRTYRKTAAGQTFGISLHSHSQVLDDGFSWSSIWDVGERTQQNLHVAGDVRFSGGAYVDDVRLHNVNSIDVSNLDGTASDVNRHPYTAHISNINVDASSVDLYARFKADQFPRTFRAYNREAYEENAYQIRVNDEVIDEGLERDSISSWNDVDLVNGDVVEVEMDGTNPTDFLSTSVNTGMQVFYEEDGDNTPPILETVEVEGIDEHNSVDSDNVTLRFHVDSSDGIDTDATHVLTAPGDVDDAFFDGDEVNPNGTWTEHETELVENNGGYILETTVDANDYEGTIHVATVIRDVGGDGFGTETRDAFHVGDVPVVEDSPDDGIGGGERDEQITGQLTLANGEPAAGHSVLVNRVDTDWFLYDWVTTDDDGNFTVDVADGGVYDVTYMQMPADIGQGFPFDGNVHMQNLASVDLSDSDADEVSIDSTETTTDAPASLTAAAGSGVDASVTETDDPELGNIDLNEGHQLVAEVIDEDGEPIEFARVAYRDGAPEDFWATGIVGSTAADGLPYYGINEQGDTPGFEMNGSVDLEVRPPLRAEYDPTLVERTETVNSSTSVPVTLTERNETVRVGNSTDADYATIQEAVDDAPDEALIIVENGIYNESVEILGPTALISEAAYESSETTGAPADTAVLDGGDAHVAAFEIKNGAENVFIEGFHVRNYEIGVGSQEGNISEVGITENTFENVDGGVVAEPPADARQSDSWHVVRNVFDEPAVGGVLLVNVDTPIIVDNIVTGDGDPMASDTTNLGTSDFDSADFDTASENGTAFGIVSAGVNPDRNTHNHFIEGNQLVGSYSDIAVGVAAVEGDLVNTVVSGNQIDAETGLAGVFLTAENGELHDTTVAENTISGSIDSVAFGVTAPGGVVHDLTVTNNELTDAGVGAAVVVEDQPEYIGEVEITENRIERAENGVGLITAHDVPSVLVAGNDIDVDEFGIAVETPFDSDDPPHAHIDAVDNVIRNATTGVGVGGERASAYVVDSEIVDGGDGVLAVEGAFLEVKNSTVADNAVGLNATAGAFIDANRNSIVGNAQFGALSQDDGFIEAPGNWWGDADGPSGEGPGAGDAVSENVIFEPWLDAELTPDDLVQFSGTVTDANGEPAAGDQLDIATGFEFTNADLDEDGAFAVDLLGGTNASVGFYNQEDGQSASTRDGSPDMYAFDTEPIDGDTDIDLDLPDAHLLEVTVEDEAGNPIEDSEVRVVHWNGEQFNSSGFGTGTQATTDNGELQIGASDETGIEVTGNVTVQAARIGADGPEEEVNLTVTEDEELTLTLESSDADAVVSAEPDAETIEAGTEVTVDLDVDTAVNTTAADTVFAFDPVLFDVVGAENGTFLGQDGEEVIGINPQIDEEAGTVAFAQSRTTEDGVAGEGTLGTVTLQATDEIDSDIDTPLEVAEVELLDEQNESILVESRDATVTVTDAVTPTVAATVETDTVHAESPVEVTVEAAHDADRALESADIEIDGVPAEVVDSERNGDTWTFFVEFEESTWTGGEDGAYETANINADVTDADGITGSETVETAVREPGDVSGNGAVELLDLRLLSLAFDTEVGEEDYSADADLTNNGNVDITDLAVLGQYWRTVAWDDNDAATLEGDAIDAFIDTETTQVETPDTNAQQLATGVSV